MTHVLFAKQNITREHGRNQRVELSKVKLSVYSVLLKFPVHAYETKKNMDKEQAGDQLLPSSFKFHNFSTSVGEVRISCRIIKMEDSVYIWIGAVDDCKMNDLTVAMMSKYEKLPVAASIVGTNDCVSNSTSLAKRLAKKCGKPVYVSFNVALNNLNILAIENVIQDEFRSQKHLLAF